MKMKTVTFLLALLVLANSLPQGKKFLNKLSADQCPESGDEVVIPVHADSTDPTDPPPSTDPNAPWEWDGTNARIDDYDNT
jgi:hypothetical protein